MAIPEQVDQLEEVCNPISLTSPFSHPMGRASPSSADQLYSSCHSCNEEMGIKRGVLEMEKVVHNWNEIRLAVEQLSVVESTTEDDNDQEKEKEVSTLAFLGVSNLLLHVLDKIGPTMTVLRQDIQRNIERLEDLYVSDPSTYSSLVEILKKDVEEGVTKKAECCARAVLWLTRSMDFGVALLERLEKDNDSRLEQVVEAAYNSTLKPWHGWISSAAYKVALKLIPERKIFISLLLGKGQDQDSLKVDIKKLITLLQPLLEEIHALLRKFSLDTLKTI